MDGLVQMILPDFNLGVFSRFHVKIFRGVSEGVFEDIWRVEKRMNHMNQGSSYCKRISEFYQQTSNVLVSIFSKKIAPYFGQISLSILFPYHSHLRIPKDMGPMVWE